MLELQLIRRGGALTGKAIPQAGPSKKGLDEATKARLLQVRSLLRILYVRLLSKEVVQQYGDLAEEEDLLPAAADAAQPMLRQGKKKRKEALPDGLSLCAH